MKFLIGVDEAGRGPLAGPIAVGLVMVPVRFDVVREFPGVKDSKQLSTGKREELYELLKVREKRGDVRFVVCLGSHATIDRIGITRTVRRAVWRGVRNLAPTKGIFASDAKMPFVGNVLVQLDGLLIAPPEYPQETIIHGDDLVPLISLASIAAKVTRDRLMYKVAHTYPEYGFERHVGYATAYHRAAIERHGLTPIHRRTFCKKWMSVG